MTDSESEGEDFWGPYEGKLYHGKVKFFHSARGYGTIDTSNAVNPNPKPERYVFFHISQLSPRPASNHEAAQTFRNKHVSFKIGLNPRKFTLMAKDVKVDEVQQVVGNGNVTSPASSSTGNTGTPLRNWLEQFGENSGESSSDWTDEDGDEDEDSDEEDEDEFGNPAPARTRSLHALSQQDRQLKAQAIELGFSPDLINAALLAIGFNGEAKQFRGIEDFINEIERQETLADVNRSSLVSVESDWSQDAMYREARRMGFQRPLIEHCLQLRQPGISFADFMELLLANGAIFDKQTPTNNGSKTTRTVSSPQEVERGVLKAMQAENQELRDYFTCKICMAAESCVAFSPCGHITACQPCSRDLSNCPYCRRQTVNKFAVVKLSEIKVDFGGAPPDSQRELQRESEVLREKRLCLSCKSRDRAVLLRPCWHACLCQQCSKTKQTCPCCGVRIADRINVFFP